jgi:hypothetical protein
VCCGTALHLLRKHKFGFQIKQHGTGRAALEEKVTGADIVVSKREWKRSLLKHSCTWENNIKMGFKERGSEDMDYSSVSEYEPLAAVL